MVTAVYAACSTTTVSTYTALASFNCDVVNGALTVAVPPNPAAIEYSLPTLTTVTGQLTISFTDAPTAVNALAFSLPNLKAVCL